MTAGTCQGCGAELPPSRGHVPRKWCRKAQYSTPCVDCGAPTTGCDGRGAHERCSACRHRYDRQNARWTEETIVAAIRLFARRYGRPPAATDFHPQHALRLGHPEKAQRFRRDACWPYAEAVKRVFGTWNVGIAAAGFVPRGVGQYDRSTARKRSPRASVGVERGVDPSEQCAPTGSETPVSVPLSPDADRELVA